MKAHKSGGVYGRWVLLSRVPQQHNYWLAKCRCGTEAKVFIGNLSSGKSVSCGCFSAEEASKRTTTHGLSRGGGRSKLYAVYSSMLNRCYNTNQRGYKNYGGRGVTVCDEWRTGDDVLSGLECFVRDMGPSYVAGLTLDRSNNNEGYAPTNCRWTDLVTQARNKRNVRLVNGTPITTYAKEIGICLSTAYRVAKANNTNLLEAVNQLKEKQNAKVQPL